MSTFAYKAIDKAGATQSGTIVAENSQGAIRELQSKGLLPTQVMEAGTRAAEKVAGKSAKTAGPQIRGKAGKKIKLGVLVNFTQQMATLVGAGSQLLDSLKLVQKQSTDPTLRKVLEEIITNIQQGDSLSEAMKKQKSMFPATMVSMIAAGEASGSLEQVLDRYGEYIQRQDELVKRFKTMLIYPSFILVGAIVLIIVLMVVVIPKFTSFLKDMGEGIELPTVTRWLMNLSEITSRPSGVIGIVGGFLAVVAGFILFIKSESGRKIWDRIQFKIPLFGAMAFNLMMARLAVTLGTLMGAGVSIIPALLAVRDTVDSDMIRVEMERIVKGIEHGSMLGETMDEGKMFPPLLIQVVRIGEEVGKLSELLIRVGNYFDREAKNSSERVMALIEPVMIVFMGLIVGTVVLAVILPILKITQSFGSNT